MVPTWTSKFFKRSEFSCSCGCGFDTVDAELLAIMDPFREAMGKPIKITSGCRCTKSNKAAGGGSKSQHLVARAVDMRAVDRSIPGRVMYDWLDERFPDRYGIGLYLRSNGDRIHFDTRTKGPARWNG